MSILANIALATISLIPDGSVSNDDFEPKILRASDNGLVVEMVISCPHDGFGIMHFDKISNVFLDGRNKTHNTASGAYSSTCGLSRGQIVSK